MGGPEMAPHSERLLTALSRHEAAREVALAGELQQEAGHHARVREVGEDAVHAQLEEHEDLAHRVGLVVRRQSLRLVAEGPRVYEQAVPVRALDQIGRAQQGAVRLVDLAVAVLVADVAVVVEIDGGRAHDVALPGSDAVGVSLDLAQPLVGGEEVEPARQQPRIAGGGPIVRSVEGRREVERAVGVDVVGVDELDRPVVRQPPQLLEARWLEGLEEHGRVAPIPAGGVQDAREPALERQADRLVVRRVLGLGVDADGAALVPRLSLDEGDDLLERRDLKAAVELRRPVGEGLHGAQRLDLAQREVRREPAVVRGPVDDRDAPAPGELGPSAHVGGGDQVGLVARDEMAVLRRHEIRLDEVGAQLDGEGIPLERVVGQVTRGTPVADDERRLASRLGACRRGDGEDGECQERGEGTDVGVHGHTSSRNELRPGVWASTAYIAMTVYGRYGDRCLATLASSVARGTAPMTVSTMRPALTNRMVGIERISWRPASDGSSSTFTFATRRRPAP